MTPEKPSLVGEQTIPADDYDRLWRAQQASELLARITGPIAEATGITHDNTAAVAEYISEEMRDVLNRSTQLDEQI